MRCEDVGFTSEGEGNSQTFSDCFHDNTLKPYNADRKEMAQNRILLLLTPY